MSGHARPSLHVQAVAPRARICRGRHPHADVGIRLALGAQRIHVGGLVLRRVALLAGIGLAAGTALGLGLGSLMSGLIFGVETNDPVTIAAVMGAIGLTATFASIAPLRHALRASPAETLRAE